MSKGIIIYETVEDEQALADLLQHIAGQIQQGYTSGYHPGWEMQEGEDD